MIELKDPPSLMILKLRKKLFLPHLDRLLGDPEEFPLHDSTDSVRVRLESAVVSIEKRSNELAKEAQKRMNLCRGFVMTCAAMGAIFLIVGISFQEFWVPCFVVAGVEAAAMFWCSRLMRKYVYDTLELQALSDRYRPVLTSCGSLDELRDFAVLVREEMTAVSIDPRETDDPIKNQPSAIGDHPES